MTNEPNIFAQADAGVYVPSGPPPTADDIAAAIAEANYWQVVAAQLAALSAEVDAHWPPQQQQATEQLDRGIGVSAGYLKENLNSATAAADHFAAVNAREAQALRDRLEQKGAGGHG